MPGSATPEEQLGVAGIDARLIGDAQLLRTSKIVEDFKCDRDEDAP
jgi:hypothetical protein